MTKSIWQQKIILSAVAVVLAAGLVGCSQSSEAVPEVENSTTTEVPRDSWFSTPDPVTHTLNIGETLVVRTTSTLSTKTNRAGETFVGSLEQPLEADGVIIAAKGTKVAGIVSISDPGGRVNGVAHISLTLTELVVNGETFPIASSVYVQKAKATVTKDAQKVGIGAGIGAVIGAVAGGGDGAAKGAGLGAGLGAAAVLGTRGAAAVVPAESVITFTLSEPITVPAD